jgi:hypothetical protein
MATVGDLIDRICDEMEDDAFDSGGQALKAINSAVKQYRGKRLYFNQVRSKSFTLATSTEIAAPTLTITGILPSTTVTLVTVDLLRIDDGDAANYREVTAVDNSYIDRAQTGAITGRPEFYSLVSDSDGTAIRWYPITDQEYTPLVTGLIRFADFTVDADTNPWVNDGETLIRLAAKRILMSEVTKELPHGSPPSPAEREALLDLQKETRLRMPNAGFRMDVAQMQCGQMSDGDITRG